MEIVRANRTDDPNRIAVTVALCGVPFDLDADESPSTVRISAFRLEPPGEAVDDCAEGEIVSLDRPLGRRQVIDGATAETVPVRRCC